MTTYPSAIDNDVSVVRIDDNLSELGTTAINQLRQAVFSIEKTIGINVQGSKTNLNDRISVFINADGTPNLTGLGLPTFPIDNNQIATNANIIESKLKLDFGTSSLNNRIETLVSSISSIQLSLLNLNLNIIGHIAGTSSNHNASAIMLDGGLYTLYEKDGTPRPSVNVASALVEINNELIGHENEITNAHVASAIEVDSSEFLEIPVDKTNVQSVFNYLDQRETLSAGLDRATLHSNGICRTARNDNLSGDGYGMNVVPLTSVYVYLAMPDQTDPNDTIANGDDIVEFIPSQEDIDSYSFDEKFGRVLVGDIVRITYPVWSGYDGYIWDEGEDGYIWQDGYSYVSEDFPIKSVSHEFVPERKWVVRINAYNLVNVIDGYARARIDKSKFDTNTWGVFVAAGAYQNIFPVLPGISPYPDGIILGNPRGAVAVGLGFDPGQLDSTHYNLYLRLYLDTTLTSFSNLPPIDVTGDAGASCGKYTIDRVVEETNKAFRAAGYNYRFIAFNQKGEFGIMLADFYNESSFSIINGVVSGDTIIPSIYTQNVIGDAYDGNDPLGLGLSRAGFASPINTTSYSGPQSASNLSTFIIKPVKYRYAVINGTRRDLVGSKNFVQGDGYLLAVVNDVNIVDGSQVVQYEINADLRSEGLKPGKTIVIQSINQNDPSIIGYGRFIIGKVSYNAPCDIVQTTTISVINGVHSDDIDIALGATSSIGDIVRIYFSDDSVGFNTTQLVNVPGDYHRYHEIFINNEGHTFGIERARILKSTQTVILFDTLKDNWRIRNVSKKIIGYQTDPSIYRYFVRLCLRNYNSSTGEFDGYIGEPNGTSNLINIGPITKGTKDNVLRFYDNTYINYIDIEYREDTINPGTIVCTTEPRIIDIEIFPTASKNDEYFLIAGVSHSSNHVMSITDLREFGTVSETNLSDSAIEFIQSGERYLHANGIVRGFEYKGVGTGSTGRSLLTFSGGLALVNGSFVPMDSYSVKLPEIKSSISDTVEYFICITKTGQLKAIVKDVGVQFFTTSGTQYFIETLSFKDIIDTRKDLTIIAKVIADLTSTFILESVTDARRFITNQDLGSFTWCNCDETDGYNANFITVDSLCNWVNEYGLTQVKVKYVKVNDTEIYLSFDNYVELIGGTYELNSNIGLVFTKGNCKIKDAKVFYTPSTTLSSINIFGLNYNYGAFVAKSIITPATNIENFIIENSHFYSLQSTPRPPFVSCFGTTNTFKNITFSGNILQDSSDYAKKSLAYAFININGAGSLNYPTMSNIIIEDTKIDGYQGLLISGHATTSGNGWINPTYCNIENCVIRNNQLGLIGFNIINNSLNNQIHILDNQSKVIISGIFATINSYGKYADSIDYYEEIYGAEYIIRGNTVEFMKINSVEYNCIISENTFVVHDSILFNQIVTTSTTKRYALVVIGNNPTYNNQIICANNIINGNSNTSLQYLYAMYIIGSLSITGNKCNNILHGIYASVKTNNNLIIGNTLKSINITGLTRPIYVLGDGHGFISTNWFDVSDRNNIISGTYPENWIVSSENFGTFDYP
jgi:hypothetical protein